MEASLWSRREFLKAGSAAALASALPIAAWGEAAAGRIAFAASNWRAGDTSGIRVFTAKAEGWRESGFHPCERPSALALGAAGDRLYVASCTDTSWNLPCGSVDTCRVEANGKLHLLHRTPLALASVSPDGIAISPDGSLLLVTASGCGLLNSLSLDERRCANGVTAVRKELVLPSNSKERALPQLRFITNTACLVFDAALGERRLYSCNRDGIILKNRETLPSQYESPAVPTLNDQHPSPLAVVFA